MDDPPTPGPDDVLNHDGPLHYSGIGADCSRMDPTVLTLSRLSDFIHQGMLLDLYLCGKVYYFNFDIFILF